MSGITEADAKAKWCPFVRSQIVGVNEDGRVSMLSNRDAAQLVEDSDKSVFTHNCIGSSCMAWRGLGRTTKWWNVENDGKSEKWSWDPRTAKTGYANVKVIDESGDEPIGYCGLAGEP